MSTYEEIATGSYPAKTYDNYYSLTLDSNGYVFLGAAHNRGTSAVYDENLNHVIDITPGFIYLEAGAYIVHAAYSSPTNAVLNTYIPSESAYGSLTKLETGSYDATTYDHFYSLSLTNDGNVFLSPAHGSGASAIYDKQLNFVKSITGGPIQLEAGDYIVHADYSSPTYAVLNANIPDGLQSPADEAPDVAPQKPAQNEVLEEAFFHSDVEGLYLTVYNRPADWRGLLYWNDELKANGFEQVAQSFTEAQEFEELYGGLPPSEQVTTLYGHLLGRTPDDGGLRYWASQLEGGRPIASVARSIGDAAQGTDGEAFASRIESALDETYGNLMDVLYVGYYERGSDDAGRDFWVEEIKKSNGDLTAVVKGFGTSTEYVEKYGNLSSEEQIKKIYENLFARQPDEEGWQYWVDALDSGSMDLSNIVFTVATAAGGSDRETLENLVAEMNSFATSPDIEPDIELIINELSGTITHDLTFGDNDVIIFNDNVIIPEGVDILIGEGATAYGGENTLYVSGNIIVEGKMVFGQPPAEIYHEQYALGSADTSPVEIA